MKRFVLVVLASMLLAACAAPPANVPEPVEEPSAAVEAPTAAPSGEHILDKLQVVSRPNKVDYFAGETFDPTGLVINAFYQDGTVEENVPWESNTTVITGKMTSATVTCMDKELRLSLNVVRRGFRTGEHGGLLLQKIRRNHDQGSCFGHNTFNEQDQQLC